MLKLLPFSRARRSGLAVLYLLAILLAVSAALPAYIQSNFLSQFVSLKMVSLFFIIANSASIIFILAFPKAIKRLGNYFVAKSVLLVYAAALLGLTMANGPISAFISMVFFTIAANLIWINMDVMLENYSNNAATGRIRTIYFTFINLGWIIAPSLSSYLISIGDYCLPFFIAACLVLPIYLIVLFQNKRLRDQTRYSQKTLKSALIETWQNNNLRGIFFISLLLQIFYSSAVVYIPFYLHQTLGLSWAQLGPIFSLMLVPFVILEIPAGILADKYFGEKEILTGGFIVLSLSLLSFFLIKQPIIWLWALVLFSSRVGAALIEAMRESYFFKIIDAKDISHINIFRASAPLGYILGPALAILILSFFPLPFLFLFLSVIVLFGLAAVLSIRDTR